MTRGIHVASRLREAHPRLVRESVPVATSFFLAGVLNVSHGDGRTAGCEQTHSEVCKSHLDCAASNTKIEYCCEDFGSTRTA